MEIGLVNYYKDVSHKEPIFKHNMHLPFRSVVSGGEGSGKTNFVANLIVKFCKGEGTFNSITIVTDNIRDPVYGYIGESIYEFLEKKGVTFINGLKNTPDMDTFDRDSAHLLIFDGISIMDRHTYMLENTYIRCRMHNVSVIVTTNTYRAVPKMIRETSQYTFILRLGSKGDSECLISDCRLDITSNQLKDMYAIAKQEPFDVLTIDVEKKQFRKNFYKVLDPIPAPKPIFEALDPISAPKPICSMPFPSSFSFPWPSGSTAALILALTLTISCSVFMSTTI
jgi:hypothetical protein